MAQKKWKTWHKITLAVIVLALWGLGTVINKAKEKTKVDTEAKLTPAQKDSLRLAPIMKKAKLEATYKLRNYVKDGLNDPKSFDVIEERCFIRGSQLILVLDYTAKNGFGGTVRKVIQAEADSLGAITKVFNNK
jgi:Na+-translocating ferredoxin:NAD+ oxidoreductase RnfG subunit